MNFPTKRIFMDKNGFRHYWQGIEYAPNLRKNVQNNIDNKSSVKSDSTDKKVNVTEVKRIGPKRKQPNRKKKAFERVFIANITPKPLREGRGTFVKTTFFCPFFGTMTMMANVDLDVE
ncbi:unnamed protein product [Colias eurytheme]|nr:unnamed protein product [Colias eurytheme]